MASSGFSEAIFFLFFIFISKSSCELIPTLPGQPGLVNFTHYSGYTITDFWHGRSLFYYFAEVQNVDPLSRPLTLWFNGGPGCSSLGFGAFMEHGPFQPGKNGQLVSNKYSWNLASNMLYVESPIGVGFSYSNTSDDYNSWNDTLTAEDNLMFIINWLEEFPKYKNSEIFLTGESYAGHYIPQLAALILEHNKQPNITPIKLKAIALGNPLLDLDISVNAADYLWSHGVISDETLKLEKTVCNDATKLRQQVHQNLSQDCINVFKRVAEEMGDIDDSDILLPECLTSTNAEQFTVKGKYASIHNKLAQRKTVGDPCITDRIFTYLNRPDVQNAFHANTTNLPYSWEFCRGPLRYQRDNLDMNIIPVVSNLIKSGIPVMLFRPRCKDSTYTNKDYCQYACQVAKDSKLTPFTKYGPWYNKKQIGGWAQSFRAVKDGKNVTYLTYAQSEVQHMKYRLQAHHKP